MTQRALLIVVGMSALALAGLALVYAVRAVIRRARARRPRVWRGLWIRAALIVGLLAGGVASLRNLPPPQMLNHPAPAAADAIVASISGYSNRYSNGNAQTVVGVSARDGVTRWTRTLDAPATLARPLPDVIIAMNIYGVYALRASDGALLWHYHAPTLLNLIAVDGARVVALTYPASGAETIEVTALSLATGAVDWRAALPASVRQAQRLVVGDSLVVVEGWTPGTPTAPTTRTVMALRAADGATQWTTVEPIDAGGGFQVQALFLMRGYAVIVPNIGPVTALRERDGATAWTATPNLEQPDNPPQINAVTADNDTIYLAWQPSHWATGANGAPIPPPVSLTALAIGGTVRWRATIPPTSTAWSSLALSDGVLLSGNSVTAERAYGGYSPNGSLLTAYDAASGRLLWRDNTPRVGVSWDMSPQISPWSGSGAVYLMGLQSDPYVQDHFTCILFCLPGVAWLYAVNVHTGQPWWRARMGSINLARPLVF